MTSQSIRDETEIWQLLPGSIRVMRQSIVAMLCIGNTLDSLILDDFSPTPKAHPKSIGNDWNKLRRWHIREHSRDQQWNVFHLFGRLASSLFTQPAKIELKSQSSHERRPNFKLLCVCSFRSSSSSRLKETVTVAGKKRRRTESTSEMKLSIICLRSFLCLSNAFFNLIRYTFPSLPHSLRNCARKKTWICARLDSFNFFTFLLFFLFPILTHTPRQ